MKVHESRDKVEAGWQGGQRGKSPGVKQVNVYFQYDRNR